MRTGISRSKPSPGARSPYSPKRANCSASGNRADVNQGVRSRPFVVVDGDLGVGVGSEDPLPLGCRGHRRVGALGDHDVHGSRAPLERLPDRPKRLADRQLASIVRHQHEDSRGIAREARPIRPRSRPPHPPPSRQPAPWPGAPEIGRSCDSGGQSLGLRHHIAQNRHSSRPEAGVVQIDANRADPAPRARRSLRD